MGVDVKLHSPLSDSMFLICSLPPCRTERVSPGRRNRASGILFCIGHPRPRRSKAISGLRGKLGEIGAQEVRMPVRSQADGFSIQNDPVHRDTPDGIHDHRKLVCRSAPCNRCRPERPNRQSQGRDPESDDQDRPTRLVGRSACLCASRTPPGARPDHPDHKGDGDRQDDHLVKIAEHGDEVGDQVDGAERIGGNRRRSVAHHGTRGSRAAM